MSQLTLGHRNISGNILQLRENLPRKTIEEALHNAAMGKPPQNPHNDPEILKAEACLANDVFNAYMRPALRMAIGAPHYIEGPEKKIERAAKKKAAFGDNCDWARHSNLLKDMNSARIASDILSERGVLTLKDPAGLPINIYIVDTDNTFIEPSKKKPGLRMMNTKFLIPIPLKDGESTYHVLELRSYLAKSAESYERSEEEYKKFREADSFANAFSLAAQTTSDENSVKRLTKDFNKARAEATTHLALRTEINERDAEKNGANILIGYTPNRETIAAKKYTFTNFMDYLTNNQPEDVPAPKKVANGADLKTLEMA